MTEAAALPHLPRESSFDRETQRLARVYAKALFEAASQKNEVESLRQELEDFFQHVVPLDPIVAGFLRSGSLGRERRAEIIKNAFLPRVGELFGNLLMVLNEHERLDLFRAVGASYFALCDALAGKVPVQVRTPMPLTPPQRESLLKKLRESLQKEAVLEEAVDPSLLGGMTLKVGDWAYDASVRNRLQEIRKQIIARSSYEIQSGRDRFSTAD
jgi:F-type H+-transporting ATPase subunit delta